MEGHVLYAAGVNTLPVTKLPAEQAIGPLEGFYYALHYKIQWVSRASSTGADPPLTSLWATGLLGRA